MVAFRSPLLLLLLAIAVLVEESFAFAPTSSSSTLLHQVGGSISSSCCSSSSSTKTRSAAVLASPPRPKQQLSSALSATPLLTTPPPKGIELANLLYDSTSTAFDAWEWTAGLGAPAALVAGAVLVTLSETRHDLAPRRSDAPWVRVIKLLTRFLLFSSFALQVVSIFVSTVTGTVLLSHGQVGGAAGAAAASVVAAAKQSSSSATIVGYTAPLELLHHHHEFEYLTIQIGFLQGLFHWLGAVALEFVVPRGNESVSNRRMNHFMASCLFTLIFWIMAFYNHHLTFYSDYSAMIQRYVVLFWGRYFGGKFRPMSLLYIPSTVASLVMGWRAFNSKPELDHD